MYKNIVFYNHFHNGDIHVSREFVRRLSEAFKYRFPDVNVSYSHKNNPNCIADIPDLGYNIIPLNWHEHEGVFVRGDTMFINTWYAQRRFHYMNTYGITFDCLYVMFDEVCKNYFNFTLSEIEPDPTKWFPKIDFSKYQIDQARNFLENRPGMKVLIANGAALSGQADNFPLLPIVVSLASKHQDKLFILTNHEPHFNQAQFSNIMYSSSIIGKNGFDLNENGFVSTYCDVIVGRASGAYTFSYIQENLFGKPKKHVCLSNMIPAKENTFWLGDKFRDAVHYTSKITVSNVSAHHAVESLIEANLNG